MIVEAVTLCETKAGKGFKIVVNGKWLYVAKRKLFDLIDGRSKACTFTSMPDTENHDENRYDRH